MAKNTQHTEKELLITKFLSSSVDSDERKRVIELLQTDASFKELFISMQQSTQAADAIFFYETIDEEKGFKAICTKAGIKEETVKKSSGKLIKSILRIAAVLIIALGIMFIWQNKSKELIVASSENIIIEKALPDSSLISLNKNSTLRFTNKFGIKNRRLSLSGEAFFNVKNDTKLPFIIDCNGLFVEVTGTTFNISNFSDNKSVSISVISGQVKVYDGQNTEILNAGELLLYSRTEKKMTKSGQKSSSNSNAWLTKTLVFEDCPLQQVINDINQYYKTSIVLEVKDISNCKLSATFEHANLNDVLEMISLSFGLELTIDGKIILRGEGC